MASHLKASVRTEPAATVVALSGEIDLASFPVLEQAIDDVRDSAPELVVLDLGELEFMDIAGLRAVLRSDERLRERGKRLAVTSPGYGVRRLLELTQQDEVLDVFASTAEALESA
jgi:anti-sigma B factor antagonist